MLSDPDIPIYIRGENLLTENTRDRRFLERYISVLVAGERVMLRLQQTDQIEDDQDY